MIVKIFTFCLIATISSPIKAQDFCNTSRQTVKQINVQVKQPHRLIEDNLTADWLKFIYHPTKRSTIDKYLVFNVGDPLDLKSIQESIRKLRSLSFIWDAEYEVISLENCQVEINIVVHDTFPFKPKISYSQRSGTSNATIGLESTNLFGSGNRLQLLFKRDKLRDQKVIEFENPNFGDEHYFLAAAYSNNSDGNEKYLRLAKPFYQQDSESAFNLLWRDFYGDLQLYDDSSLQDISEYATTQSIAGIGWGNTEQFGFEYSRFSLSFVQNRAIFSEFDSKNRNLISLNATLNLFDSDYLEIKNLRNMSKNEDYNQGLNVSFNLAASYDQIHQQWGPSAAVRFEKNIVLNHNSVLLSNANFRTRNLGLQSDESRFFGRIEWNSFSQNYQQSWNAKLRFDYLIDPSPENYIIMDEAFSVRGYPYGYRIGDKMTSINIEKRWFNIARYFDVFDIASVIFYDAGFISVEQSDLFDKRKTTLQSGGFGLRISPTKLSNDVVVHIDLAFPQGGDIEQSYQLNFFGLTHF